MHWLLTRSQATWLALLTLALLFGPLGTLVLLTYLTAIAAFWSTYLIYTFLKESILKLLRRDAPSSEISETAIENCRNLYDLQLSEYWRSAREASRSRIAGLRAAESILKKRSSNNRRELRNFLVRQLAQDLRVTTLRAAKAAPSGNRRRSHCKAV